jgi:hypothetical protein
MHARAVVLAFLAAATLARPCTAAAPLGHALYRLPDDAAQPTLLEPVVFGGKPITWTDPVARSVVGVRIWQRDGSYEACSGVLIAPQIVLTAAHCTIGIANSMKVYFATDVEAATQAETRSVAAFAVHDDFEKGRQMAMFQLGNPFDLAVLRLDRAAPASYRPMRLAGPDLDLRKLMVGSVIGAAGYGGTFSSKTNGDDQISGERLHGTELKVIDDYFGLFQVDQRDGSGVCTGDSGSPAYVSENGELVVVGTLAEVVSPPNEDDYCRGVAQYVDLRLWKFWLDEKATQLMRDAATHMPPVVPPTDHVW